MEIIKEKNYVALDLETTGLDSKENKIIEIGAAKYIDGVKREIFATFVNPDVEIPEYIVELTGITNKCVKDAPKIQEVLPKLIDFIGDFPILGHNIPFDYAFLKQNAVNMNITIELSGIDTHEIAKKIHKDFPKRNLEVMCNYYSIFEEPRHRAFSDAIASAHLYDALYDTFINALKNKKDINYDTKQSDDADTAVDKNSITDEKLQKLFEAKPLIVRVKKNAPITKKQEEFLKRLIKQHEINYEKKIESLTKSQASREIDLILSTYGRKL